MSVNFDEEEAIGTSPIPATSLNHVENNVGSCVKGPFTVELALDTLHINFGHDTPLQPLTKAVHQAVITGSGSGYQGFYLAYWQNSC